MLEMPFNPKSDPDSWQIFAERQVKTSGRASDPECGRDFPRAK